METIPEKTSSFALKAIYKKQVDRKYERLSEYSMAMLTVRAKCSHQEQNNPQIRKSLHSDKIQLGSQRQPVEAK